ncbi:hypothetical protein A5645_16260 [Mycobacterium asiaticum]|nr:hypothetical protein A5645_16260 [Mycobacterium asiaticum]
MLVDGRVTERRGKPLARVRSAAARFVATCGVLVSLGFFGIGAYDVGAYLLGTPTTATVQGCATEKYGYTCVSAWSVGGRNYVGKIQGMVLHRYASGTSLEVRVLADKAYTKFSGLVFAGYGLVFGLITAVGILKFASAEWFDPWLSRRPKWMRRMVLFVRNFRDPDGGDWF